MSDTKVTSYKPAINSLPITTAIVVKLPELIHTEVIWTNPAKVVDDRSLWERTFKLNLHKLYKTENRGYKFKGKTSFTKAILLFNDTSSYILDRKIERVDTMNWTFYGVIPVEEIPDGTVCMVDCFEPSKDFSK